MFLFLKFEILFFFYLLLCFLNCCSELDLLATVLFSISITSYKRDQRTMLEEYLTPMTLTLLIQKNVSFGVGQG